MIETVLKMAIADSMEGVTPSDIYNFMVTDASTTTRRTLRNLHALVNQSQSTPDEPATPRLRSNPRPLATGDAISTSYTIQVTTSIPYTTLSAQLSSAVETGAFNEQLHTHALEQGVPVLANATSAAVETVEVTDSGSDSGSSSADGTIIGAATAGGLIFVLIVLLIVYYLRGRPVSGGYNKLVRTVISTLVL